MHRVELKVNSITTWKGFSLAVPNAPCGVERLTGVFPFIVVFSMFLMHRVELKVGLASLFFLSFSLFLMHRVELKAQTPQNLNTLPYRS